MKERYLRTDTQGRVRTPAGRREQLLDEFEQTGASAAAFARIVGVRYSTFAAWVNRRKKGRGTVTGTSGGRSLVHIVEATVSSQKIVPTEAVLLVELPGGGRVRLRSGGEIQLAAELLGALAAKGVSVC